jgi:hypothetical protein
MEKPWNPIGADYEPGYRKAGVIETLDADGTVRLGAYDHLLLHWTWCDDKGDIVYPDSFPNWQPTHWREADLPDYWPYESQEAFVVASAATPLFDAKDLQFDTIRFGVKDVGEATSAPQAAQIILTNMFYQTFDDDRTWTNEEWSGAIRKAAERWPAFDAILSAERTDWRNDDFAEAVGVIRDAGGSMKD